MARPIWTIEGIESLQEAAEFIGRSSTLYASEFVARIVDATEHLERFPEMGRVVPEFGREDVRELTITTTGSCTRCVAKMS